MCTNALTCTNTTEQRRLIFPDEILQKLRAEQDRHELSRDWVTAPKGCAPFYADVMGLAAECIRVSIHGEWMDRHDPTGEFREWLTSEEHRLLAEHDNKLVTLSDPEPTEKSTNYPGSPTGGKGSGRQWGPELGMRIGKYIVDAAARVGRRLSHSEFTRTANSPMIRELFGLDDPECMFQYCSKSLARTNIKRLKDAGEIHVLAPSESYRSGHRWANLPPLYAMGPRPEGTPAVASHHSARFAVRDRPEPVPEELVEWARTVGAS